ncbi:MAG: hypothetical protein SGI92_20000 [Bryobacteraceae bacterium]|nr:hypothetical protein [Bryobacteraceae bacterium]
MIVHRRVTAQLVGVSRTDRLADAIGRTDRTSSARRGSIAFSGTLIPAQAADGGQGLSATVFTGCPALFLRGRAGLPLLVGCGNFGGRSVRLLRSDLIHLFDFSAGDST